MRRLEKFAERSTNGEMTGRTAYVLRLKFIAPGKGRHDLEQNRTIRRR